MTEASGRSRAEPQPITTPLQDVDTTTLERPTIPGDEIVVVKSVNLYDLPQEILFEILVLSCEPSLILVCRRTLKSLPPFAWLSTRVAALALYTPIFDHRFSDFPVHLHAYYQVPWMRHYTSPEEKMSLQRQVLCSRWFTLTHLRYICVANLVGALGVAAEALKLYIEDHHWREVYRHLRQYAFEDWPLAPSFGAGLELDCFTTDALEASVRFHAQCMSITKPGGIESKWQLNRFAEASGLGVLSIPSELITQVSQRSDRALRIVKAMYDSRDLEHYIFRMFNFSPEQRLLIFSLTQQMLTESISISTGADPSKPLRHEDEQLGNSGRGRLEKLHVHEDRFLEMLLRLGAISGAQLPLEYDGMDKPSIKVAPAEAKQSEADLHRRESTLQETSPISATPRVRIQTSTKVNTTHTVTAFRRGGPAVRRAIPEWMTMTRLGALSVWVDPRHYEDVVDAGNVAGFARLLKFNRACLEPNPKVVLSYLRDAQARLPAFSDAIAEMQRLLTEAKGLAESAREEAKAEYGRLMTAPEAPSARA